MIRTAVAAMLALAAPAWSETASWRFVWEGANGYSMTGAMAFEAGLIGAGLVQEEDVICFVIEGFHEGVSVGRWALTGLNEETTWRLHFDPVQSRFIHDGEGIPMPQAWNMNGAGTDCGDPGFGFNLGNLGQDFCRNNAFILESRVPPPKPFPAVRDDTVRFPADACIGPDLLSRLVPR